jgi:hypothetical protein
VTATACGAMGRVETVFSQNGAGQYFWRERRADSLGFSGGRGASFLLWGEPGPRCSWGLVFVSQVVEAWRSLHWWFEEGREGAVGEPGPRCSWGWCFFRRL